MTQFNYTLVLGSSNLYEWIIVNNDLLNIDAVQIAKLMTGLIGFKIESLMPPSSTNPNTVLKVQIEPLIAFHKSEANTKDLKLKSQIKHHPHPSNPTTLQWFDLRMDPNQNSPKIRVRMWFLNYSHTSASTVASACLVIWREVNFFIWSWLVVSPITHFWWSFSYIC